MGFWSRYSESCYSRYYWWKRYPSKKCNKVSEANRWMYKKSEDLSPVNTLPVLVPPCAAGAKPTNNIFALVSPKPVIGFPQYFSFKNCFLLVFTILSLNLIRRGHCLHLIILQIILFYYYLAPLILHKFCIN